MNGIKPMCAGMDHIPQNLLRKMRQAYGELVWSHDPDLCECPAIEPEEGPKRPTTHACEVRLMTAATKRDLGIKELMEVVHENHIDLYGV